MSRNPLDMEHRRDLPEWLEAVIVLLVIVNIIIAAYALSGGWG